MRHIAIVLHALAEAAIAFLWVFISCLLLAALVSKFDLFVDVSADGERRSVFMGWVFYVGLGYVAYVFLKSLFTAVRLHDRQQRGERRKSIEAQVIRELRAMGDLRK